MIFVCSGCRNRGCDKSRAVAVEHTSEVEFAGFEQAFHFGVEQVDKCSRAVLRGSDRLVRKLDFAEKVFERECELRIIVAAALGKIVVFFTAAHAAVDAVGRKFLDFFAPHVA